MKKALILCLLALTCTATQAQKRKEIKVRAISSPIYSSLPKSTVDEQTGLKTIEWPSTENNSWHENIGIVNKVPVEKDIESIYGTPSTGADSYVPMNWRLTDEGKNTILHCYFVMKSDIVTNLWLANAETTILDKETGIIYQAKSTRPEACYDKVFSVKGTPGTVLDMQIVFPLLPESAKKLVVYGVPNWYMRGRDIRDVGAVIQEEQLPVYDSIPKIHLAHMVKDSVNYDANNHESWAVFNDAHTIKPVEEGTMALWRTPDATYLAIATEHNWIREYYGPGGKTVLMDSHGHQYKCKGTVGYQNGPIFWLEGYPGDYFALVLVFEPLPRNVKSFTYIEPEGEPFDMWGASWEGKVIPNLMVDELRKNQKLFEYQPRVVVK